MVPIDERYDGPGDIIVKQQSSGDGIWVNRGGTCSISKIDILSSLSTVFFIDPSEEVFSVRFELNFDLSVTFNSI